MNPPTVAIATPVIPKTVLNKLIGSTLFVTFEKFMLPSTANAVKDDVDVSKNPIRATSNPATKPPIGPFATMPAINPAANGPKKGMLFNIKRTIKPAITPKTNTINKYIHSKYKNIVII